MKTEENIIIIGVMAFIAYNIYKNWKGTIPYRNDAEVRQGEFNENDRLIDFKTSDSTTTYKFSDGDWSKLNFAQRFLYGIGVPEKWIFE